MIDTYALLNFITFKFSLLLSEVAVKYTYIIIVFQKRQAFLTSKIPACDLPLPFPVCLEAHRMPGILQAGNTFAKNNCSFLCLLRHDALN